MNYKTSNDAFSRMVVAMFAAAILLACGARAESGKVESIDPAGLNKLLQAADTKPLIVDVREPSEYDTVHIEGAMLKPLGTVAQLTGVDKSRAIVLVCRSGRRSAKAYGILEEQGYTNLRNLEGGMVAWEKQGFPVVKK